MQKYIYFRKVNISKQKRGRSIFVKEYYSKYQLSSKCYAVNAVKTLYYLIHSLSCYAVNAEAKSINTYKNLSPVNGIKIVYAQVYGAFLSLEPRDSASLCSIKTCFCKDYFLSP